MNPSQLNDYGDSFRSAIEACDFTNAGQVLQEYVAWFRSERRTVEEIEHARDLFAWGIQATRLKEARMSEQLMLLKRVCDAYGPPRRFHTWRLEG